MVAMHRLVDDRVREHERISCAGPGPRWRAKGIEKARTDPMVWLGDQMSAAAEANDVQQVQSFLEQGADPNHIHFMVNPNHPLCRTTSPEVAKVLLAHPKIDVNVQDINGLSILCRLVLDPSSNGSNVQLVAAILNHEDLDVHASCPIATAARFASVEMMRLLLDHPNLDINDPSGLLHCAMRRTDPVATDLAAWLLQHETLDINLRRSDGTSALMALSGMDSVTIEVGEKEAVKLKQIAARQVQMLKMLLQRPDLEVNAVDAKHQTALHHFSVAGRSDLVELVLQEPRCLPSLVQPDAEGRTPLDLVAEKSRGRPAWDAPLAKYPAVIAMLTKVMNRKKVELEQLGASHRGDGAEMARDVDFRP